MPCFRKPSPLAIQDFIRAADPDLIDPRAGRAALDRHGLGVVAHTAWFIPIGSPFGTVREASLTESLSQKPLAPGGRGARGFWDRL